MEQHAVPQNIASFQFKLFGNLTVRQFVTLAIPASVATIIFFTDYIPTIIRLPLTVILGLFGFIIALVPIGGRPFEKWILAFVRAIFAPTQRLWIKEERLPEFLAVIAKPLQKQNAPPPESLTEKGKERLLAYIRSLPKEKLSSLDVAEQTALRRLGIGPIPQTEEAGRLPPPIIWPSGEELEIPYNFRASLPQVEAVSPDQEMPPEAILEAEARTRIVAAPTQAQISAHAKPYILPGVEKKLKPKAQVFAPQTHLASETNFATENIIPIQTPDKNIKLVHGIGKTRVRKLHFAPPVGFDLSKLPIRGKRRFEISEELKQRYALEDPFLEKSQPQTLQTASQTSIKKENRKTQASPKKQGLPNPTQFVPREQVNLQADDVSPKQEAKEVLDSKISITGQKSTSTPLSSIVLSPAQIVPLTNRPNVLSGLITSKDASPIVGAILIVRDTNGIPIRALKTNKLGQFLSATPLENGQYSIEVEGTTSPFKQIIINLTGQVLAPMEIKAEGEESARKLT